MDEMKFGKHRGLPVGAVPEDYLIYLAERMGDDLPAYVLEELKRRAQYSIRSYSVICGLAWQQSRASAQKSRKPRDRAVRMDARQKSRERLSRPRPASPPALKPMGEHVGGDFDRLRLAHLQAGGEHDSCPFDSDEGEYEGPTLRWRGSQPLVEPSEFPLFSG